MANFLAELKRRHIFRVAAAYAVVAWVLLQLAANVSPLLDLPPWIGRTVLLLLVLGFPVALLFAWIHQLVPTDGALGRAAVGKLDWFLAGALVIVIGLVSYQQLAPSLGARMTQEQPAARSPATSAAGAISIAVLPFVNLSSDAEQEFFSDGMTEEITSALAKVSGLIVIGRTSAFQFKGQNQDLRAIGQALSATHLIEGSVRKAGDRVRITAQLIRADSGAHLWTENYDRQLTDIFATQEDIAQAIAAALRVPLGLQQGERLVSNRSIDPESYQQYLRAKALVRSRGRTPLSNATALLERVVARDANYAPAWALLAQAYALTPTNDSAYRSGSVEELRRVVDATLPRADAAARRAIQLDANDADGYSSLGLVQNLHGNLLLAAELYSKALGLDPNNPDALHRTADMFADLGLLKEALAVRQQLQALEPFVPVFKRNTAGLLWLNGQTDAAVAMLKTFPADDAVHWERLAMIDAAAGRYGDAADALQTMPSGQYLPGIVEAAVNLLRTAPVAAASPRSLPRLGFLGFVYFHVGAAERMLEIYERNVQAGYIEGNNPSMLWHPVYAPLRNTERFKAYLRAAGRVEYWRAKGWPEFCHAATGDDFVCA